jgi:hypothetical protein
MCKLANLRKVVLTLALGLGVGGCGSESDDDPSYAPPAYYTPTGGGSGQADRCCKYCTVGQPCGDTCISLAYNCSEGVGCACWGY